MGNYSRQSVKFSLELNEQGIMTMEMQGSAMDIGMNLFIPFFESTGMYGKSVASGIFTALQVAYPDETARLLERKVKKNI